MASETIDRSLSSSLQRSSLSELLAPHSQVLGVISKACAISSGLGLSSRDLV
jgi:hypothetical protein